MIAAVCLAKTPGEAFDGNAAVSVIAVAVPVSVSAVVPKRAQFFGLTAASCIEDSPPLYGRTIKRAHYFAAVKVSGIGAKDRFAALRHPTARVFDGAGKRRCGKIISAPKPPKG